MTAASIYSVNLCFCEPQIVFLQIYLFKFENVEIDFKLVFYDYVDSLPFVGVDRETTPGFSGYNM